MKTSEVSIGIIGGIGLGCLIGSEFSGRILTYFGAILIIIFLFSIGYLNYKGNANKTDKTKSKR